ncbi:hypothetical protein WJX72_006844 [[Myrmecia] bisecta]|uniref:Cyclin-like domain-containing protein n=1 Tax=[Myrmecia] bisecta TaxID=41462 RepID=A0AAW1PBU0_9CHLO
MFATEVRNQAKPCYLEDHPYVTAAHRQVLVEWQQLACMYHRFGMATCGLAVNLLDRFLAAHTIPKEESWAVQLAATACLSIAAKMEEVNLPSSLAQLQAGAPWAEAFAPVHVKAMEFHVLEQLGWRTSVLTPLHFLDRLMAALGLHAVRGGHTHAMRIYAENLITKTFLGEQYLCFRPSTQAAAAILISMQRYCQASLVTAARAFLSQHLVQVDACLAVMHADPRMAACHHPLAPVTPSRPVPGAKPGAGQDSITPKSVLSWA